MVSSAPEQSSGCFVSPAVRQACKPGKQKMPDHNDTRFAALRAASHPQNRNYPLASIQASASPFPTGTGTLRYLNIKAGAGGRMDSGHTYRLVSYTHCPDSRGDEHGPCEHGCLEGRAGELGWLSRQRGGAMESA